MARRICAEPPSGHRFNHSDALTGGAESEVAAPANRGDEESAAPIAENVIATGPREEEGEGDCDTVSSCDAVFDSDWLEVTEVDAEDVADAVWLGDGVGTMEGVLEGVPLVVKEGD